MKKIGHILMDMSIFLVSIIYLSCVYHVSHDSDSHKSPEIQTLSS